MPVEEHQIRLPLSAEWLERVQSTVSDALRAQSSELRAAGLLAASELAENVMKFGRPTAGAPDGAVNVQLAADELRVSSESGSSPERFRSVVTVIERIASCRDTELLYLERLSQLLRSPGSESSGLGLIRVAHEGAFVLRCSYEAPTLTITAVRKLA